MQKRYSVLMVPVLVFLLGGAVFANGGPSGGSALSGTGNIVLEKVDNVKVVSESLLVKPVGDDICVKVSYTLECAADRLEVNYGFPFRSSHSGEDYEYSYRPFTDENNHSIRFFMMDFNGQNIPQKEKIEEGNQGQTKWYLSRINLKKGRNVITVMFRSEANYVDWSTSKSPYTSFSRRKFSYRFRPAAGWGSGIAGKLSVTIDAADIAVKKGDIQIKGLEGFRQVGTNYQLELQNADFSTLKDLLLSYDTSKFRNRFEKVIQAGQNDSMSRIKSASASSTLKGPYGIEKAFDGDYATAWAEGAAGQGIGERINLEFKENAGVKAVALANGVLRNRKFFLMNSRIKTLMCTFSVKMLAGPEAGKVVTFAKTVELKPVNPEYIPENDWRPYPEGIQQSYVCGIAGPEDFLYDYELVKASLVVDGVYPGTKFEDTCITEIFAY